MLCEPTVKISVLIAAEPGFRMRCINSPANQKRPMVTEMPVIISNSQGKVVEAPLSPVNDAKGSPAGASALMSPRKRGPRVIPTARVVVRKFHGFSIIPMEPRGTHLSCNDMLMGTSQLVSS